MAKGQRKEKPPVTPPPPVVSPETQGNGDVQSIAAGLNNPESACRARGKEKPPVTPPPPVVSPETQGEAPIVEGQLTSCDPRRGGCGSTERTRYTNHREIEHQGVDGDRPYTHVVWRDTTCKSCSKRRCDKHFENRLPLNGTENGSTNGSLV